MPKSGLLPIATLPGTAVPMRLSVPKFDCQIAPAPSEASYAFAPFARYWCASSSVCAGPAPAAAATSAALNRCRCGCP